MAPSIFQNRKDFNADRALTQIAEIIKGSGFQVYATSKYEDWYTWTGVRMRSGLIYKVWTPEYPQKQRICFKKNVKAWSPFIKDFLSQNASFKYCVLLVFDGEWCELNITNLRPKWCSCPNAIKYFTPARPGSINVCPLCTIHGNDALPVPAPARKPARVRHPVPRRVSNGASKASEPPCTNAEQHPEPAGS